MFHETLVEILHMHKCTFAPNQDTQLFTVSQKTWKVFAMRVLLGVTFSLIIEHL